MGAVVGHTLASMFVGRKAPGRVVFYDPIPKRMSPSPLFDYWLLLTQVLQDDSSPHKLAEIRLKALRSDEPATLFARANFDSGFSSPLTGQVRNPFQSARGALSRSIFWGLIYKGFPEKAERWCRFDVSLDYGTEATLLASAIAHATSELMEGGSLALWLEKISGKTSSDKKIQMATSLALESRKQSDPVSFLESQLPSLGSEIAKSWCRVLSSLLVAKNFQDAVTLCSKFSDTDDDAVTLCGSITAIMFDGVPEDWLAPIGTEYISSFLPIEIVPNSTILQWIVSIQTLENKFGRVEGLPPADPAQSEGNPPAIPLDFEYKDYESCASRISSAQFDGAFLFPSGVFLDQKEPLGVGLEIINRCEAEVLGGVTLGNGLQSRTTSIQLQPGEAVRVPILVSPKFENRVLIGADNFRIPVLSKSKFLVVGPFPDSEDQAFVKDISAEFCSDIDQVFSLRSGLSGRWESRGFDLTNADLEPIFGGGAGVVIASSELEFPGPGTYRMICCLNGGVVVKIDNQKVLRYKDSEFKDFSMNGPASTTFSTLGTSKFVFKFIRNNQTLNPAIIYFLDSRGQVIYPISYPKLPG